MPANQRSITLFSGLAVRKAFEDEILDAFLQQHGVTVDCVFDPTVQLLKRIDQGESFDVMIAASPSFDKLNDAQITRADSVTPFVRTGLGLGVAPGSPTPAIDTVEQLVDVLTSARSVAYSRTGQSGIYFVKLVEQLGIADEVLGKASPIEKGFTAEALSPDKADIAVQQVSELMFVPGTQVLGFLPEEVQHYTEFSAAVGVASADPEASTQFIDFLSAPRSAPAYEATMLLPTRK